MGLTDGAFTDLPHVPRLSAFLDARGMVADPVSVFERYRAALGPTFTFHFGGARRAVVSTDPDFIEHVLKHNRERYRKSDIQTERMVEFQGRGLVNLHGEAWRRQRKLVSRGFRRDRLAELLPVQQLVLDELMVGLEAQIDAGPVDVHAAMVRLTLGLVGKSIFGRAMSDAELQQIADAISEIQAFIVRQIVQPYLIPWFRISGQSEIHQAIRREADAVVLAHVAQRRREGSGETDLLEILLETPYHDTGEPMTDDKVKVEALQLLVAGNETSSNGLTWVFYLLGRHPEHVDRIREEIDRVIGAGPITPEALRQLQHTTQVIYEALRLYPPFWMIDRIAVEDDEISGIHIPAGTMVIPYIYGTHRNRAFWEDPERFDPSRFDEARRRSRPQLSYLPFGGGPRICVGNHMAVSQMLLILVTVIRRWDLCPAEGQGEVGIRPMMLLRPDGGVWMDFRPHAP